MNRDVSRRLGAASDGLERHSALAAFFLLALIALAAFGHAAVRLIWYDEIVTLGAAALPRWRDVWGFYAQGLDTPSPISSLLAHATLHWPGSPEINMRLPFLAAFMVMLGCMYLFLRRRYPAAFALAVILIPIQIDRWFYYAFEARAYAFVLAGTAIALVCWQAAPTSRRPGLAAFGTWCGLALAMFAHAFAIFLFIPFAAAQLLRDKARHAITWSMWLALLLYPLGYLPVLPGERNAGQFYRAHFFSRPHLSMVPSLYRFYFGAPWFFITLFMAFAVAAVAYQNRRESLSRPAQFSGFSNPEWLLLALLAALPIYAVPGAMLLGALREPYIVSFNIGFWLLAVGGVAEALHRRRTGGELLLLVLFACLALDLDNFVAALHYLPHPGRAHADHVQQAGNGSMVQLVQRSQLPIVVGDHILYSKLFFYADPALRARLFFAVDPVASQPYENGATPQTNFKLFGPILGYHVADWPVFAHTNPHFLLLQGYDPNVWFFPYLRDRVQRGDPVTLKLLGENSEGTMTVYDVQVGPGAK